MAKTFSFEEATAPNREADQIRAGMAGPMGATDAEIDREAAGTREQIAATEDPQERQMLQEHLDATLANRAKSQPGSAPRATFSFEEATRPPAQQQLPAGVKPSNAGAGRGSVNPPADGPPLQPVVQQGDASGASDFAAIATQPTQTRIGSVLDEAPDTGKSYLAERAQELSGAPDLAAQQAQAEGTLKAAKQGAQLEDQQRNASSSPVRDAAINAVLGSARQLVKSSAAFADAYQARDTAANLDAADAYLKKIQDENGGNTMIGKTADTVGSVAPTLAPIGSAYQLALNAGLFGLPAFRDTLNAQIDHGAGFGLALVHAVEAAGIAIAMPAMAKGGNAAVAKALGTDALKGGTKIAADTGVSAGVFGGITAGGSAVDKLTDLAAGQPNANPWVDLKEVGSAILAGGVLHSAPIGASALRDRLGTKAQQFGRALGQDVDSAQFAPANAGVTLNPNLAKPSAPPAPDDTTIQGAKDDVAQQMADLGIPPGLTMEQQLAQLQQRKRAKQMRDAGEGAVADELDRRANTQSAEDELPSVSDGTPHFEDFYRTLRSDGVKPAEAATRAGMLGTFAQHAQQAGITPRAIDAATEQAGKLPLAKVPQFLDTYASALSSAGMGQALPARTIETSARAAGEDAMHRAVGALYDQQLADLDARTKAAREAIHAQTAARLAELDRGAEPPASPVMERFPPESGTLGLSRDELPQIQTDHHGPMVNFLNARGVEHEIHLLDPNELKPSQAEFSPEKVRQIIGAKEGDGSILVSSDGYVLDGHHRWMAAREKGEPIKAIVLQAPIRELVGHVKEFPSAKTETAAPDQAAAPLPAGQQALRPDETRSSEPVEAAGGSGEPPAPVILGRGHQPIDEGGKPFRTTKEAQDARKLTPHLRVVRTEGGFALTEKTPAQLAAQENAARRLSLPNTSPKGQPIPAHAFIAAEGGLRRETKSEIGIDGNVRVGNRNLFAAKGKGLSLAQASELLHQHGYMPEEGEKEAIDIIQRSLKSPQYTAEGWQRIGEMESQTRYEDHLKAVQDSEGDLVPLPEEYLKDAAADELTPEQHEQLRALIATNEAKGIDTETLLEDAARKTENGSANDYYQEARRSLQAAAGPVGQGADDGARAQPGRAAAGPEGGRGGGEVPRQQGSPRSDAAPEKSALSWQLRDTGTLAIKGDPAKIREVLKSIDARSFKVMDGGYMIGRTQVDKALRILEGKPEEPKAAKTLSMGTTPGDAEPVTIKDGVVHVGKYEAVNFDTGEPVKVKDGASSDEVKQALRDAGVLGKRQKFFGGEAGALSAPTKADVLAQQDRAKKAPALDEKQQIDREAEKQTLTQPVAPEQRKDTTGDLMGGPTAQEALAAKRKADEAKAKPAADDGTAGMFSRGAKTEPFYSALGREVDAIDARAMPAEGWASRLKGLIASGKVKADEVAWSGLDDFLKLQQGKVTKEQIAAFLKDNGVQVKEVVHGGMKSKGQAARARDVMVKLDALGYDVSYDLTEGLRTITRRSDGRVFFPESGQEFKTDPYETVHEGKPEESLDGDALRAARRLDSIVNPENDHSDRVAEDGTKYGQYTLPGGNNYREVLLTLPTRTESSMYGVEKRPEGWVAISPQGTIAGGFRASREEAQSVANDLNERKTRTGKTTSQVVDYRSPHFDEPNVLAHIRLNDRTDADGKRVLFVEEIQSDWAQAGRKEGFDNDAKFNELVRQRDAAPDDSPQQEELQRQIDDMGRNASKGVPRAPFVEKTDAWLSLALKRIVKMAADEGYDRVAFVNGEQSADRYDLSKQVDRISYSKAGDDRWSIDVRKGGDSLMRREASARELEDLVGKDVAKKIVDGVGHEVGAPAGSGELHGLDLKVGGEGMKSFYDKIVPSVAKDVLKKLGGDGMREIRFNGKGNRTYNDLRALSDEITAQVYGRGTTYDSLPAESQSKIRELVKKRELVQPGFDITAAMREKAEGGLPLFRRGEEGQAASRVSETKRTAIDTAVQRLTRDWLRKPQVHVIDGMDEAPKPVYAEWQRQESQGASGEPEGFHYRGDVYLLAPHLKSMDDVRRVLFHESIGHFGLRGVFGDRLKPILNEVAAQRPELVAKKAEQYGLDVSKPSDRLIAAEEVLAEMAQSRPEIGFVRKAIAAIRTWLREHGIVKTMSDDEIIRNYILTARGFVERGRDATKTDALPAFSRSETAKPDERKVGKLTDAIAPYKAYAGVEREPFVHSTGIADSIARALQPAAREGAGVTAGIVRANLAEQARGRELAQKQLEAFAKKFDKMPVEDNYKFIDAMERGQKLEDPKLQEAADALRKVLDERRDQVIALGKGKLENFNENYFPHIWKDRVKASNFFSRRPLEGGKGFLKQRTHDYFSDGLEAGLEPITTNPVELALLKAREMDRYIYGQRIFAEMKENKVAKFVRFGDKAPEGWEKINDKIARVTQFSETEKAMILRGEYYAPEPAATIINNHLSPGLTGIAAFDMVRKAGSMINGAQLGLSAFHLGFTTLDAMISKAALGVKQASRGDVGKGALNLAQSLNPAQPLVNLIKGDRLLKAYMGELQDPGLAPLVDALVQGGGRVKMDDIYRNASVNEFRQAIRKGKYGTAAMKALPRLMDLINKPIFEYLVPRQKLGVFFDMARDALDKNPDMSVERKREVMGKLWDSVDNRMGELVYDNVFWNRALKDSLMVSVRSVGWNLGTFREIGGGAIDLTKVYGETGKLVPGKDGVNVPEKGWLGLSDRTAYIFGLAFVTSILGSLTNYLYTGEGPKELKDVFFPRTGKLRPDGSEDRLSLPSYMKDIYEYGHDLRNFVKYGDNPFNTVVNKLHPLISTLQQIITNKDFFGGAIRSPGDTPMQQAVDEAAYMLKQITPFSLRNYIQQAKVKGEEPSVAGYLTSPSMIGITPSPGYITKNDAQAESAQVSRMHDALMQKFREQLRDGEDWSEVRVRAVNAGIQGRDLEFLRKSAQQRPPRRLKAFAD